jgi:hypothetical protein
MSRRVELLGVPALPLSVDIRQMPERGRLQAMADPVIDRN